MPVGSRPKNKPRSAKSVISARDIQQPWDCVHISLVFARILKSEKQIRIEKHGQS